MSGEEPQVDEDVPVTNSKQQTKLVEIFFTVALVNESPERYFCFIKV